MVAAYSTFANQECTLSEFLSRIEDKVVLSFMNLFLSLDVLNKDIAFWLSSCGRGNGGGVLDQD
jgi:hypothetical protein